MKIKVLVVDDSPIIRDILSAIVNEQDDMTVIGTAPDPLVARDLIAKLNPDVLTLDIEMPNMNGLAFLKRLMAIRPMPVVMLSSFTQEGSDVAFQALALGAVDVVGKPAAGTAAERTYSEAIAEAIRGAFAARDNLQPPAALPSDAREVLPNLGKRRLTLNQYVAIGAGAGGPEALRTIIRRLPDDSPAVLVSMPMPTGIARHFARRLNSESVMKVREATEGEPILEGNVYLTPGGQCMSVRRYEKRGLAVHLHPRGDAPYDKPCDVLFESLAEAAGPSACGVVLTGLGVDGAAGLAALRAREAHTIAQDEATSLVYGMPRAAVEAGAAAAVVALPKMAEAIRAWASWAQVE